jgi:hypothetical protein
MDLTQENKAKIDNMSYTQLLSRWRNSPNGDTWFQGETGDYWSERMKEMRNQPDGEKMHVEASKLTGWK